MLQPIEGDANDKGKHKFMVQSMYATDACEELDNIVSYQNYFDVKHQVVFKLNQYVYFLTLLNKIKVYKCLLK